MISATDLKNGVAFEKDGAPYQVIKYEHKKLGRGSANIKVSAKNLESGQIGEFSLTSNSKFKQIQTIKRRLQFLYKDKDMAYFISPDDYTQYDIDLSLVEESDKFFKEGGLVDVLFWENRALSVDLPPKVDLKVKETEMAVKGNSATNVFKPATLENGLVVKVPLFINKGDTVRVDTRDSSYVERVNEKKN